MDVIPEKRLPATRSILGAAWNAHLESWEPLLGATLLLLLLTQLPLAIYLIGPFYVGFAAMCLAAARGNTVRFDQLFDQYGQVSDAFVAGGVYAVCASIPTSVLMVASLLLGFLAMAAERIIEAQFIFTLGFGLALLPLAATVLLFTPSFFLLADGEAGWSVAMRKSAQMVRANWAAWTGLWVVLGLAHLAGTLACCLPGIFITPWMGVAAAMLYDCLREATPAPAAAPAGPPAPPPMPGLH